MRSALGATRVRGWEEINSQLRVVRISAPLQALVPALFLFSYSPRTRGFTFYGGKGGLALGSLLVAASLALGALLWPETGAVGGTLAFWLLGTTGAAMAVASLRPTALVKPICVGCRLLPLIKEHESMHLSGVASESRVWASMRARHSVDSLSLEGDPAICSFCPIPKRLSGH